MAALRDYLNVQRPASNAFGAWMKDRPERPTTQFDGRIELLRIAAILGVLIQHAGFSRYSDKVLFVLEYGQEAFGWCVIAFFAISGRLTAPSLLIDTWVRRRGPRLLPPFLFASLVFFLAMRAIFASGAYVPSGGTPTLGSLAWSIITLHGFGPHLYFLPYLFLIGCASLLVVHFLPQWAWLAVVVASAVMTSMWLSTPASPHGAQLSNIPFFWLAFILGHAFRSEYPKKYAMIVLSGLIVWGIIRLAVANDAYIIHLSIPFILYRMLPSRASRIQVSINVGAIYLWHTPIVMPGVCILLSLVGVHDFANLILTILLASTISLAFDRLLRYLPWGRFLTL